MISIVRFFASMSLCALCVGWVGWPDSSRVVRPRLGVPAVTAPGESFILKLESSRPFGTPPVRVELERMGAPPVELELRLTSSSLAHHSFEALVPESLAEGAWSMVVRVEDQVERMPKAVHVRRSWPDSLTVVQLADLPEFFPDGSGAEAMGKLVDEINLVAPDLVMLSGDVAYGGSMDRYESLLVALERFDAPVVVVIGNHEYKGLAGFMTHLRLPSHVVDAGPLRIVSVNSAHGRDQFTTTQLSWIEASLASAGARTPIVQLHHSIFEARRVGARRDAFVGLCKDYAVPIILSGHWHADRVFDADGQDRRDRPDFEGPIFAVATAAGASLNLEYSSGGNYHGYRVIRLDRPAAGGRFAVRSYTYDFNGDGTRDASASHPAGKLSVARLEPGAVLVTNDWNEDVPRAHVWIDLPEGKEGAVAQGWRTLGTRARTDGSPGLQFGVELDLPPISKTEVRVLR